MSAKSPKASGPGTPKSLARSGTAGPGTPKSEASGGKSPKGAKKRQTVNIGTRDRDDLDGETNGLISALYELDVSCSTFLLHHKVILIISESQCMCSHSIKNLYSNSMHRSLLAT